MDTRPAYDSTIDLLRSQSLSSLVQREIERMILSGEISAGEKLTELGVAERLGVSRGPVREAFRGLAESGLVRMEKNRGVFVRTIAVEEADEGFAVREALEEMIGRALAERITEGELSELRALLVRMEKAAGQGSVDAYSELNFRFHDRLVALTGNGRLVGMYQQLVKELILFRRQTLARSEMLAVSLAEHREIVEKIAARDPMAAGRAMAAHVRASRERMHESRAIDAGEAGEERETQREEGST